MELGSGSLAVRTPSLAVVELRQLLTCCLGAIVKTNVALEWDTQESTPVGAIFKTFEKFGASGCIKTSS